jgi:hypothetical protein
LPRTCGPLQHGTRGLANALTVNKSIFAAPGATDIAWDSGIRFAREGHRPSSARGRAANQRISYLTDGLIRD